MKLKRKVKMCQWDWKRVLDETEWNEYGVGVRGIWQLIVS